MAEPTGSGLGVGRPTKRRAGASVGGLEVADPRPVFADGKIRGARCTQCRYAVSQPEIPWCPVCYSEIAPEDFPGAGVVFSSTVVAIPVGQRRPPFGLAYLDLDDGPRLLVHLAEPKVLPLGARLRIVGTDGGDLVAEVES
jgi:uncharacterized OB-fold protein